MQFVFATATDLYFNFNLRNPRKVYTVSATQEEKQSKNLYTTCGPAFSRFRSGKTTWKGNSTKSRSKNKLLEKGMKTPSSLVIDLQTSISNCYYRTKIHKEGCQSSPWQQKLLVLSHVPQNLDLSIWSISTNLSYFFLSSLGYWVSGV